MRPICDVLSARKNELDISIDDIADKSGVPRSTVAKIISGATPDPQYQRLSAIVGALDYGIYIYNPPPHPPLYAQ